MGPFLLADPRTPEKAVSATAHRIRFPQVTTPKTPDLFLHPTAAKPALHSKHRFLPFLANAIESWHALLVPVRLHRDHPNLIFDANSGDPAAPCMVITTAGFILGPRAR